VIRQQLKREIFIEAPPEIVWKAVTEPEHMALWLSDSAQLDLRAGGVGTLTWHPGGKATEELDEPLSVPVRVETIEPPHQFRFRWSHPADAEPTPENSLLVEFRLTPQADGTRLTVLESGFAELGRPEEAEAHDEGWTAHLERLRQHLTQETALK
jgi:uncharacterized protein YndB with AHSA1/START domain